LTKSEFDRSTDTASRDPSVINANTLGVSSVGNVPLSFPRLKLRKGGEDARLSGDFSTN
jgi:hypothetical protein